MLPSFHRAEAEAINEGLAEVASQLVSLLSESDKAPRAGETTDQALDLYQEWVGREFSEAGRITLSGRNPRQLLRLAARRAPACKTV
jgi:hypothetical protein